ncbi:MAG TPA: SRPBCC family protein [Aggregatilinea sp.]|jgi:uncharacterized protein YndB with AHSA1/START domain|uniref:SRPBCC family protein n=1 Tax=Aggregatilinea sp. TaxID=2806333 RepID=UPI002D08E336|nr:SRPBCC family protein [Aggregatilinea sp.]HML22939.1 SRPBCC family protein [Aggregatilinea sp.]
MSKLNLIAEPGQLDIRMIRDFDAPRELVFKACTDPALVAQWWGLKNTTTVVEKLELKMGGLWRFIEHNADGEEHAFRGVYHEVTAPERLVYTFEYEPMPGHILLETIEFEEHDGKTRVIDTSVYQSVEDRDGMLSTGMSDGAEESWDRLEELLAKL